MTRSHESDPTLKERIPYGLLYDVVLHRFYEAVSLSDADSRYTYWTFAREVLIGSETDYQNYAVIGLVDDFTNLVGGEGAQVFEAWIPLSNADVSAPKPLEPSAIDSHILIKGRSHNRRFPEPSVKIALDAITKVSGRGRDVGKLALLSRDNPTEIDKKTQKLLDSTSLTTEDASLEVTHYFSDARQYNWSMGIAARIMVYTLIPQIIHNGSGGDAPEIEHI